MKNPNANVVRAFISFVSVVKGVKVVIGVKAKCKRSAVDFFNILRSIIINKTNVPADLRSAGI